MLQRHETHNRANPAGQGCAASYRTAMLGDYLKDRIRNKMIRQRNKFIDSLEAEITKGC